MSEKKSGARSKQTLQTRRIQLPRKISFTLAILTLKIPEKLKPSVGTCQSN
ncbi:MAG: hypothetical protein F6K58_28030 [Symploca sp. SIO2E9]|nr:hypothetical protein [Symploca sp. SIO2E9]